MERRHTITDNIAKYDEAIKIWQGMLKHRQQKPTTRSEELFFRLLCEYHEEARRAREEGRYLAAVGTGVPLELFRALDIVPYHIWWGSNQLVGALKNYEEAFALARDYGLPSEVCSVHRILAAVHTQGWAPKPDFVVWSSHTCENCNSSGKLLTSVWGIPAFYMDRPHEPTPSNVRFFAHELEELAEFLQDITGQKLDRDRLTEAISISQAQYELEMEVYEMRKAVPSPTWNRYLIQHRMLNRLYVGTREGLMYTQLVRDEMKEAMEASETKPYKERFRILSLCPYGHLHRLADWMQKEWGACLVADPLDSHWGPWQAVPSRPWESMAAKSYADPVTRSQAGPVEVAIDVSVRDALDFRVCGAIFWAHRGCTQACGIIRLLRDALRERAGIPMLVLDIDVYDPTFVPEDELKEKLEGFFELLESR